MNGRRSLSRFGMWRTFLLGLLVLLIGLLVPPQSAQAHPADVYLQATYITVAPTQIVVELDLTPGVLVAPQVLPQIDTDGDQQIEDAEGQAYVDGILWNVALKVDGQPLTLIVTKIDMPQYLTSRQVTERSASSRSPRWRTA